MQDVELSYSQSISVNKAFSKQSVNYDQLDQKNQVLLDMRSQVYHHVFRFLKTNSHLLELNAGTGIDASYFVNQGCSVLATDLSNGMIEEIEKKIYTHNLADKLSCQQLSYVQLSKLSGQKFDYIFSNFGGLNCIDDLSKVTQDLPTILKSQAFVTWVIMPPICLWELKWILTGKIKQAFRRFHKDGVTAHLEGEYFKTYYHSLSQIRKAFGPEFKLIKVEGLCALSPPPASLEFPTKNPRLYLFLQKLDGLVRHSFPFNRWADHIIVTFQYQPS